MSFKEIDINDKGYTEGRSCIIVCNFGGKEVKLVKNCASMAGIKDIIMISQEYAESVVKDIIDNKELIKGSQEHGDKAIIFNNIPNNKISLFMDVLKRVKVKNVLYAVTTDVSKEWSVNELISNLIQERIAMRNGEPLSHS